MYYDIHQDSHGEWIIYKVTNGGQTYQLFKTFPTKQGAEGWAKRVKAAVVWR